MGSGDLIISCSGDLTLVGSGGDCNVNDFNFHIDKTTFELDNEGNKASNIISMERKKVPLSHFFLRSLVLTFISVIIVNFSLKDGNQE